MAGRLARLVQQATDQEEARSDCCCGRRGRVWGLGFRVALQGCERLLRDVASCSAAGDCVAPDISAGGARSIGCAAPPRPEGRKPPALTHDSRKLLLYFSYIGVI